jgi:hypothetical protein
VSAPADGLEDRLALLEVLLDTARDAAMVAVARGAELEAELTQVKADRDDYERRWLAAERARGDLQRQLDDEPACTCEPQNAYLCLRCERIAESQDIGF